MQSLTSFTNNDLYEALNTLKTTSGIFSKVEKVFSDIYCYDTDNEVVLIFKNISSGTWDVTPQLQSTVSADGDHKLSEVKFTKGYLCAQGLYLITGQLPSGLFGHIVITKGSNGECCTIMTQEYASVDLTVRCPLFITAKGDDTSLIIYTQGIYNPGYFNGVQTNVADRTILEKIPIVGTRGSNDYVTGCFTIFMRQFQDPGNIIIDGKNYYCRDRFAILDE